MARKKKRTEEEQERLDELYRRLDDAIGTLGTLEGPITKLLSKKVRSPQHYYETMTILRELHDGKLEELMVPDIFEDEE